MIGPHGLVVPFDPKPRILPLDIIEIYRYILDREAPAFLRLDFVAEEKRRAALLIAMHEIAVQQAGQGAS